MASMTVRAFAKINLSLRVMAKRPDGFHEVQTILQAVDLSDRLTCQTRRGSFHIRCSAPGLPVDRTNLVWRAAEGLWNAAGRSGHPRDAMVTLEKNIPMQAGLGGGSSDAASALVALRRIWKLKVADEDLLAIAARLGSDVPYFFVGGTALALGRGEQVYPLVDLPRWWAVLIVPPFGIRTADAYAWLDQLRARTVAAAEPRYLPDTWLGRIAPLANDLERPVIDRHPAIGRLIGELTRLGAVMSAMSGSGSTVFGVFMSSSAAGRASQTLRDAGARTLTVRFLGRRPPRRKSARAGAGLPVSPSII
jgi:4-diphosphocytidyl-2-C-methyl-D-erythritol kinase